MRIVQPQCMRLKRIVNAERRKVRNPAEQVEWIIRRIATKLIFEKCFVSRGDSTVEPETKCVGGRFKFPDCTIVLNHTARHVGQRIQPGESQALRAHAANRNTVVRERKSGIGIDDWILNRREVTGKKDGIGNPGSPSDRLPDAKAPIFRIKICLIANHAAGVAAKEVVLEWRNRGVGGIEEVLRVQYVVSMEIVDVPVKSCLAGGERIVVSSGVTKLG